MLLSEGCAGALGHAVGSRSADNLGTRIFCFKRQGFAGFSVSGESARKSVETSIDERALALQGTEC
jgi:hypothetical protein